MDRIEDILSFEVCGRFAHFKKYYSNISSLSYEVPPRTVIAGMIASLLEMPRDSYYELLGPDVCKIGVQLLTPVRKLMQCMNYLKKDGGHTQVRLELLLPLEEDAVLSYRIWCAHEDTDTLRRLRNAIRDGECGFGLYFGQRPFRAHLRGGGVADSDSILIKEEFEGELHSLTYDENIQWLNESWEMDVSSVSMPINMRRAENGREPDDLGMMTYERTGKPLSGRFGQVVQVGDEVISFFTPV